MSLKAKILPNYTYDDYVQWEGRWEIIDGIAYAMAPMPVPHHQEIAGSLHSVFRMALKKQACQCKVFQPIDLLITKNTVVNPDLLIVCKPIEKKYLDFPPELVVEILSPSTALKDRHSKFDLYQDFGIKYYLIVDTKSQVIEIYQLDDKGAYQLIKNFQTFKFSDDCEISPDLSDIWN